VDSSGGVLVRVHVVVGVCAVLGIVVHVQWQGGLLGSC